MKRKNILKDAAVKISKPEIWQKLPCSTSELHLRATLDGGQSFRWKKCEKPVFGVEDVWLGTMANCLWALRQTNSHLLYKVLGELPYPRTSSLDIVRMKIDCPKSVHKSDNHQLLYEPDYYEQLLKSYFRLEVNLEQHYAAWSASHKHFQAGSECVPAVRLLNQEPVENLFSFICSQNNNISRISTLVEKLCELYGTEICKYDGVTYRSFPGCEALSKPNVDAELRIAKFGYRAKFIQKSAAEIMDNGYLEWFDKLQNLDYKDAHIELMKLTGIGPKVADCICLMSLSHLQAIPVDTHVFKIAAQHYIQNLGSIKSVTPKIYSQIGDRFREVYGPLAGWAQTVLFCADLTKFQASTAAVSNKSSASKKAQT